MHAKPELKAALTASLERFSPPRHIAGNPAALEQEVSQLLDAFARFAPSQGFEEWWISVTSELGRRIKTRAWPLVGEVELACQNIRQARTGTTGEGAIEAMILDPMETWFRRFKSQMPGYGRASRTVALIQRGVFASEREARFFGFDLSHEMRARVDAQPASRAENAHHISVMDKLDALNIRVAENAADAAAKRATVIPRGDGEVANGCRKTAHAARIAEGCAANVCGAVCVER